MKKIAIKERENKKIYTVLDKIRESSDVSTIKLSCLSDDLPDFIPGQYITVYFPETGTVEGKAYSISSSPFEKTLNITVKSMGEFSGKLSALRPYDTVKSSLPYGYFYSESKKTNLVMIAAGIGIAPFRSIILYNLKKYPSRRIDLFYSARTTADFIFKKEFDDLASVHKNFSCKYFVTRENVSAEDLYIGRLNPQIVLHDIKTIKNTEFMVCGSISFTRDIWKGLKNLGIPEESIYTEAFFSH